jgi:hypothetical protein
LSIQFLVKKSGLEDWCTGHQSSDLLAPISLLALIVGLVAGLKNFDGQLAAGQLAGHGQVCILKYDGKTCKWPAMAGSTAMVIATSLFKINIKI